MKRYPLTHTMNTRDLGGYPLAGGGETRFGRLLRSDAPITVTPQDAGPVSYTHLDVYKRQNPPGATTWSERIFFRIPREQ